MRPVEDASTERGGHYTGHATEVLPARGIFPELFPNAFMSSRPSQLYEFGPFRLDPVERVLLRDGRPVPLRPKVFDLLLVLVGHHNHLVEKDELMSAVWPEQFVEEGNLNKTISMLRLALGENGDGVKYIETVPKHGYRFIADVREGGGDGAAESANVASAGPQAAPEEEVSESEGSQASLAAVAAGEAWRRTKGGQLPRVLVGVVLAGLTAAALYYWVSGGRQPPGRDSTVRSIAVLPLSNLSGDPGQEYFADGMTEALINELAKVGSLRVISRTSVMQYKAARKTTPEIGRELNVDALVEGSVIRSGERVRITAQLIRAATDEHLWAESYERDPRDVLALQSEVARGITDQIRVKLTPQEQARLAPPGPINPAAHEAYLKGIYYFNEAINSPHVKEFEELHRKSFAYFEQAIRTEPEYAPAYAGLARSYHWLASAGFPHFYPKAKEAAQKAIAIDDSLAEAHGALAYILWNYDWDWAGAEREFKRTKELNPGLGNVGQHGYALFLSAAARHDEAIREMKLAQDLDPLTLPIKVNMGWVYFNARQYDQAAAQFQSVLELRPDHSEAHIGLCLAHIRKGMHEEGIAECQRAVELSGNAPARKADLAWAYALTGRRREAIKTFDELMKTSGPESISPLRRAKVYVTLGEKDRALAQLEEAYAERLAALLWLNVDPEFDGLRSDPRFADLLRRVGPANN